MNVAVDISLERVSRIELPSSRWQRVALPLSYTRIFVRLQVYSAVRLQVYSAYAI